MNKKTIRIITLGCSKNQVDSEKLIGQLPPDRYRLSHEGEGPADVVIVNTCGFIQDAKQESIDTILEVAEARKAGIVKEVLVSGCLSQRYLDSLKEEIPEVDAWFGVDQPEDIFNYLNESYKSGSPDRLLSTPSHYAYLKVAEGCDRSCSFCAIPMIRGPFVSLSIDQLVEEASMLADRGVKELILVAQELTYYGVDTHGKPMLAPLLRALNAVEGISWIRLHYAYPRQFPEEVLEVMAAEPKICNYLDIPLQHINNEILRSMRRGHDREGTLRFIEKLRNQVPGIALRTTLMTGFPGETEEAFRELLEFVERIRFDRLGVFTYSPEEGTTAYSLGDPVPQYVKEERAAAIMEMQSGISLEINHSKIGQRLPVLVDREEAEYFVGRTEFDSPEVDNEVLIEKAPGIAGGHFANVLITGATEYELFAKPDACGTSSS
ncbi:MAG: 30S ribosomal protein S12 methylthiotransferase RimO [Bacteroidales bacterium]